MNKVSNTFDQAVYLARSATSIKPVIPNEHTAAIKRQRRFKVQPLWDFTQRFEPRSEIRLRGKWLSELFPANTFVVANITADGKIVIEAVTP